ncbi:hypothetical protein NPX13_g11110 [Xylaria arbuscula]|uniref:Uncharacterized protein n=1 Tax=Xylaria arbuscula TaxID=114810 RepID=A0A9W8N3I5_9PEZI|nr:hypothetical protein NPX13_g11110 [Xylaria arbuscula]
MVQRQRYWHADVGDGLRALPQRDNGAHGRLQRARLGRRAIHAQCARNLAHRRRPLSGLVRQRPASQHPACPSHHANETDVQPTRWGELDTFTTWTFQASGPYAELTESTFVANIRIAPSDNSDTISYIDYRFSKVLPGPACEEGKDDVVETVWNAGEL